MSKSWLLIAGADDSELNSKLEAAVEKHYENKDYAPADVSYIAKMHLKLVSGTLEISDTMLEKLRRLCQLWDVALRPQNITSHRKIVGPFIVLAKKLLFSVLQVLLKDFIRQQRAFNAAAVDAIANAANNSNKNK